MADDNDNKEWTFTIDLGDMKNLSERKKETAKAEKTSIYTLPKLELEPTRRIEISKLTKTRSEVSNSDRSSSIKTKILIFIILLIFGYIFVFK